jgi:hypothetical protein
MSDGLKVRSVTYGEILQILAANVNTHQRDVVEQVGHHAAPRSRVCCTGAGAGG